MTEAQEKKLAEYNAKLERMFNVYKKYPMQSVSDSIQRVYDEMAEDEDLAGLEL